MTTEANTQEDVMLNLAGWIKDFCRHLTEEIENNNFDLGSKFTRHHINQWADPILTYLGESTGLPCPSCDESIPLRLHIQIINDLVYSLMTGKGTPGWDDLDYIKSRLEETADEHMIECKDHNDDCHLSDKGWVALAELLAYRQ